MQQEIDCVFAIDLLMSEWGLRSAAKLLLSLAIEQCIIRETFFITSAPPPLGAYYNNEKNISFLTLNRLFLNNVKVESYG